MWLGRSSYAQKSFLVADTQLYKRLCPSVCPSVCWSIGPSAQIEKWENKRSKTFLVANSCISPPAHLSATDDRVSGLVFSQFHFFQNFVKLRIRMVVNMIVGDFSYYDSLLFFLKRGSHARAKLLFKQKRVVMYISLPSPSPNASPIPNPKTIPNPTPNAK